MAVGSRRARIAAAGAGFGRAVLRFATHHLLEAGNDREVPGTIFGVVQRLLQTRDAGLERIVGPPQLLVLALDAGEVAEFRCRPHLGDGGPADEAQYQGCKGRGGCQPAAADAELPGPLLGLRDEDNRVEP